MSATPGTNGSSRPRKPPPRPSSTHEDLADAPGTNTPNDWSDDPVPMPEAVQAKFDALPPDVRETFSPRRRIENVREFCKTRIRVLRRLHFEIEEMVAIARAYPAHFGKLRSQTWATFAAIIGDLKTEDADNARKAEEAEAAAKAWEICRPVARDLEGDGLELVRLNPIGAANIKPRQWAYGKFLLFGSAAVIGAVDGVGKGVIAVSLILATTTGKELLGERVWRTGPVGIITYEDDEEEWHRRIAAGCKVHQVDYEHVIANIYFIRRPGGRVTFAQRADGAMLFPDSAGIIKRLKHIKAVLLLIDPFNNAHEMDDGNNNVLIARVAAEITHIAKASGVAALVLHHLRKGSTGDLDDLMGATSLRANFRGCRIFARMTIDEANALGVPVTEAWRHLRIADTKANYATPPERAVWFRLASEPLGNAAGIYTDGDELGVAVPWTPPSVFEGIELTLIERIFAELRTETDGRFYSPHSQSQHWAGNVIMRIADKTKKQAAAVLKVWEANEVLRSEDYWWHGNETKRVVVNDVQAAKILARLHQTGLGE
jgi:hypothetical protein